MIRSNRSIVILRENPANFSGEINRISNFKRLILNCRIDKEIRALCDANKKFVKDLKVNISDI